MPLGRGVLLAAAGLGAGVVLSLALEPIFHGQESQRIGVGSVSDPASALALPLMLPGWLLVIASARGLDALTLGEETAASLGFDPRRTQWLVVTGTALAVGVPTVGGIRPRPRTAVIFTIPAAAAAAPRWPTVPSSAPATAATAP